MSAFIQRVPGAGGTCRVVLTDLAATKRLGMILASWCGAHDVIALSGDLGTGKTELARAIIRAVAAEPRTDVPSPTFPIVITYDFPRFPVVHADLYRIAEEEELDEIGWDELADDALVLVEWADRAGERMPRSFLDISLSLAPDMGPEARIALLTGHGEMAARLERLHLAEVLIESTGFGAADRVFMQGDASPRSYTRLVGAERSAILMNAPPRPDGAPVPRGGVPYSRLVHLAEDVKPFVAMDRALLAQGFSAPLIYAADIEAGLLVLEDLGREGVLAGSPPAPIVERYEAAMDVLATLHSRPLPHILHVAPQVERPLPTYDIRAFLAELDLLVDWYLPAHGIFLDKAQHGVFHDLWRKALAPALAEPRTWVMRDYHSPNFIWLPQREGLKKVGLIDFQDALLGPAAYDVASLAQDARIDVPEQTELHLVSHYMRSRKTADPAFDMAGFARSYALMGAQRATKILGIFTRLDRRDGKPGYLRHIPHMRRYLARGLGHPDLAELRAWYDDILPAQDTPPKDLPAKGT
ncbi:MAG: tRNA (adenosine(37)-N6)-threonylcarbamoyltransferase complex ATPase subunit type 1 TsaE [Xanthobacter sp.]